MIVLDRKKPISALKLIHTVNHTQTNRFCDISSNHLDLIKPLDYTLGERIYDLRAGLYKIIINNIEYIIDVHIDIRDRYSGDFLVIKNENDITLYAAGSTPYHLIPYKINSIKDNAYSYDIESINGNIDIIIIGGEAEFIGTPSLDNPAYIGRISHINIKTNSGLNYDKYDSLTVPFNNSLGRLLNGARDYIIINTEQLIAHKIINTSRELLPGSLSWEFQESYSDSEYYVFFAKYPNVKFNNTADSIRCSHFESVSCDELIDKNTKKNCISTSYESYENGIWIKIAASVLDIHGDKNFGDEMQKWVIFKNTSSPIYIEYEISNTIYKTFLIDEYNVKTWYPNTTVTLDNNQEFSVFYKALKSL